MAGIKANSATQTMGDGDTAADQQVTGYLKGEQIVLTVTGTPASVAWGQALPSDSAPARSALSADTGASVRFTPDVAGYYVITANAAGTSYVMRIAVLDIAASVAREAIRLLPRADEQVPTPSDGIAVYCGPDETLRFKDSSGTVHTVTTS